MSGPILSAGRLTSERPVLESASAIKLSVGLRCRLLPGGAPMKPVTLQDYRERMLRVLLHIQRKWNS